VLFDGIDQTRLGTLAATAWWLGAAVVLVGMKRAAGRHTPDTRH
jgi:hypothetical protein